MQITDIKNALKEAKEIQNRANTMAGEIAGVFVYHIDMKQVPSYMLRNLKRKLRNFNMKTCSWND